MSDLLLLTREEDERLTVLLDPIRLEFVLSIDDTSTRKSGRVQEPREGTQQGKERQTLRQSQSYILPLCDLLTCRTSSHRGRNGFSPHKKVPVKSHNDFSRPLVEKGVV